MAGILSQVLSDPTSPPFPENSESLRRGVMYCISKLLPLWTFLTQRGPLRKPLGDSRLRRITGLAAVYPHSSESQWYSYSQSSVISRPELGSSTRQLYSGLRAAASKGELSSGCTSFVHTCSVEGRVVTSRAGAAVVTATCLHPIHPFPTP